MRLKAALARFLLPRPVITLIYLVRYGCMVSPRAEVELSRRLVIGKGSRIGSFTKIKASHGQVSIGAKTDIATGCFLGGMPGGLTIGDHCLIGPNCSLLTSNYVYSRIDQTFREQGHTSKGTRIGSNVLIGAGSVIQDGSDIGDGVMVAANSVVSGKVAANSIVQGDPAKVIFVRR